MNHILVNNQAHMTIIVPFVVDFDLVVIIRVKINARIEHLNAEIQYVSIEDDMVVHLHKYAYRYNVILSNIA